LKQGGGAQRKLHTLSLAPPTPIHLQIPALPGFSQLRRLEFSYNEVRGGLVLRHTVLHPGCTRKGLCCATPCCTLDAQGRPATFLAAQLARASGTPHHPCPPTQAQHLVPHPKRPQIHSIGQLAALGPVPLQELYIAANKVPAITGLEQLSQLTTLELGSNRIKQVRRLWVNTLSSLLGERAGTECVLWARPAARLRLPRA